MTQRKIFNASKSKWSKGEGKQYVFTFGTLVMSIILSVILAGVLWAANSIFKN